jgi:hypothetical protein
MAFGKHWEWRGFGDLSSELRAKVEALPLKFPSSQDLTDEYLWVPGSPINVKLRLSDLKFKRLVESSRGLELWLEDPNENYKFPLEKPVVEKLAKELGIVTPPVDGAPLDRDALLRLLDRSRPRVELVPVQKSRWQREWRDVSRRPAGTEDAVIVEVAEIFAPERTFSVGIEHPRAERVAAVRDALGLARALRPISYLGALEVWARGGRVGGR